MTLKTIYKIPVGYRLLLIYVIVANAFYFLFNPMGLLGRFWETYTVVKLLGYTVIMTHLTITCMSLSFHRFHTHKGVLFNKYFDYVMQIWLWMVTSMSKLDWVSVHQYHHITSDTPDDPHSPVHKGFWHVLFLGVFDYTAAKSHVEVIKLRSRLQENKLEKFMGRHLFMGPSIMVGINMLFFGVFWGSVLSLINFLISPIFAVGGVNTLAHWWGYRNHPSKDNSRNVGFIFPLNFLICGELDHNNHHGHQKSCTFRHKWYEFDIGYFYIKILRWLNLAEIKTVYNPQSFKFELAKKATKILEADYKYKERLEKLARELNITISELQEQIKTYLEGKKVNMQRPVKEFARELKIYLQEQCVFELSPA